MSSVNKYEKLDALYEKVKNNLALLPDESQQIFLESLDNSFKNWEADLKILLMNNFARNNVSSKTSVPNPKIDSEIDEEFDEEIGEEYDEEDMDDQPSGGQIFQVELETGEIVDAELLACVEIDDKEYAVYSIDNEDGTVDILASYVSQDDEGYDTLKDIDNPADKEKISNFIKSTYH